MTEVPAVAPTAPVPSTGPSAPSAGASVPAAGASAEVDLLSCSSFLDAFEENRDDFRRLFTQLASSGVKDAAGKDAAGKEKKVKLNDLWKEMGQHASLIGFKAGAEM